MGLHVLAVSDGRPAAEGALRLAAALAAKEGVKPRALALLQPLPVPQMLANGLPHVEEVERARAAEIVERVREQASDLNTGVEWEVSVCRGSVGEALEAAGRDGADLVVVPRNGCERFSGCGGELLALARASHVPVVLAGADVGGLPSRGVVGLDFGPMTLQLARTAALLMGAPGSLRLTHVLPQLDFPAASLWGWNDSYVGALPGQFRRLREDLGEQNGLELTESVLEGDPVGSLLGLVKDEGADLLALGSVAYTYRERVTYCGVPSELARRFAGAVLLVPPRMVEAGRPLQGVASSDTAAGGAAA